MSVQRESPAILASLDSFENKVNFAASQLASYVVSKVYPILRPHKEQLIHALSAFPDYFVVNRDSEMKLIEEFTGKDLKKLMELLQLPQTYFDMAFGEWGFPDDDDPCLISDIPSEELETDVFTEGDDVNTMLIIAAVECLRQTYLPTSLSSIHR